MFLHRQQPYLKATLKRAAVWLLRLALFLAAPELYAQAPAPAAPPYVLSERVGAVLDAEERAYFNFFPRLEGFASAAVCAPTDTTVAFAITRRSLPDTTIIASREAAKVLGRYVDLYERLFGFGNARRLDRWSLVIPFAHPKKPFREGQALVLTTREGERISGRLLYIDADVVALSRASTPLERMTRASEAVVLLAHEIKHVEGQTRFLLDRFETFEIPWAGNDSLYAAYTRPKLEGATLFRVAPSPEIRGAISQALARRPTPAPPGVPFDRAALQILSNRLHLALSYPGAQLAGPERDYDVRHTPSSAPIAVRRVLRPRPTYALEATYSVTKRLRLGGLFQRLASPGSVVVDDFTGNSYSRISGLVLAPIATYAFNPVNRLDFLYQTPLFTARRTELRLGAGPAYARLTKETTVAWRLDKRTLAERLSETQQAVGLALLSGFDFYPFASFSVSLTARAYAFPGVRLEAAEVRYTGEIPAPVEPPGSPTLVPSSRWIEGGAHALYSADLALGVRFHF